MPNQDTKTTRNIPLILGAASLAACGGGDVSPGDFAAALVPRCTTSIVVDDQLAQTQVALTKLGELVSLATDDSSGAPQPFSAEGDCGGWVFFTPQPGTDILTTDYDVDMQDYCVTTAEENLRFNGQLGAQEISRETEQGTLVSELHTSFTDLYTYQGEEIFRLSLEGGKVIYGRPTESRPLPPTSVSPDVVTITRFMISQESAGITNYLNDFSGKRWEEDGLNTLLVTGGRYTYGYSGATFRLDSDSTPLLFDPSTGEWLEGTLILLSDKYPRTEITPTDTPGEYQLVVPASPGGSEADCGVAEAISGP